MQQLTRKKEKTLQEAIRLANDRKSFPIWLTQFGA